MSAEIFVAGGLFRPPKPPAGGKKNGKPNHELAIAVSAEIFVAGGLFRPPKPPAGGSSLNSGHAFFLHGLFIW
ncbi:MAG: hypothetical protein ACTSQ7_07090 [Alphaproteobacteria bacterium]